MVSRIFAIDPNATQFLVWRRLYHASYVASIPPDNLIRVAAFFAPLFRARGPTRVGVHRLTCLRIPEQGPAFAVTDHAHVDSRECGRTQFRGAECFPLAIADALQEVFPQGLGVVPCKSAG